MNSLKFIFFSLSLLVFTACSNDDRNGSSEPFVVAFENLSANIAELPNTTTIALVYSETAAQNGEVRLSLQTINATYGTDFTTEPAAVNNEIFIPIQQGTTGTSLIFNKVSASIDETVEIKFTITQIDYPSSQIQGNTQFSLNSSASLGRSFEPNVGGPNEGNQVYIDLSSETETVVARDNWDLGFYSGNDFRVMINGSIYMAAAQLQTTNIDAVTQSDVTDLQSQVAVGTFNPVNEAYVDAPDGAIGGTTIAAISENNDNNKVYLVNLGYEVGTETPLPGSVAITGDTRGWKKIRILRNGTDYVLQYANIGDTNHQEVTISKSEGYNFTFFSFNTNTTVSVEPKAENWDINFTVFTNIIEFAGAYGFSDGVLNNRKGGVTAYLVNTNETSVSYDDFTSQHVNASNFEADQRTIGSSWRDVMNEDKVIYDHIFYVIKDPNGNIYKLKFTALLNDAGERGYPEFKYNLLQ
ncbi:MAG: HmuY family protein [Flavobacteriaceae bacterium]|nr:HmuY family protein [Flavobacteriaceae bacterium]